MAAREEVVIVLKTLDEATGTLKNVQKTVETTKTSMIRGSQIIRKTYKWMGGEWVQTQEMVTSGVRKFRMELLSVMFFGMQLKKTFSKFLTEALNTYSKITENQTALGKAIMRTQAAWEFFKFSLIEALRPLILWVTEIAVKFMDWASAHPVIMKLTGALAVMGLVLGTLMFLFGMTGLGIIGVSMVMEQFSVAGTASIGAVAASAGVLAIEILAIVAVIYILYRAWKGNWLGIGSILDGAWVVIKGVFKYMVSYFVYLVDSLGWVANNWKIVWTGIKLVFYQVAYSIIKGFEDMVNFFIKGINSMVKGYNSLAGILHLPKAPLLETIDLTSTLKKKLSEAVEEYKKLSSSATLSTAAMNAKRIETEWKNRNIDIFNEMVRGSKKAYSRPAKSWAELKTELGTNWTNLKESLFPTSPLVTTVAPKSTSNNLNYSPVYNITGVSKDEIEGLLMGREQAIIDYFERVKSGGA